MKKEKISILKENGSINEYDFAKFEGSIYGNEDSAGHDTHDGDGKGHERGDHTNHYLFVKKRDSIENMSSFPSNNASLEEILKAHL